MIVLGLSGGLSSGIQDSAAAIIVDGEVVAAAEEERFSGIKFSNGQLPKNAISFCLKRAGISLAEVDLVVSHGRTWKSGRAQLESFFELYFGYVPRIELVNHHSAHAASTYFASGATEAVVATMDFSGDGISTSIQRGSGQKLEVVQEFNRPNSLGIYYAALTQFLGFVRDSDEYKVMGMAAYGNPVHDFSAILEGFPGGYSLNREFLRGFVDGGPAPSKHEMIFDALPIDVGRRLPGEELLQTHFDVAASGQKHLENVVHGLLKPHIEASGVRTLCLAGGVALNSLMNQYLRESLPIDWLYVPPVAGDAGIALGCAYIGAVEAGDDVQPLRSAYLGPEFSSDDIRTTLTRSGARFAEVDDPARHGAGLVAAGLVVGWFQGSMEYGPRALGNRSILANPLMNHMQDRINEKVKFREEFRPVAPAVLHSHGGRYFDKYTDSPYMTQTFAATKSTAELMPVVVHADGSSRLQSVHAETNPMFASLLQHLDDCIGVPVSINTSLNAYNDPIACAPHQALRTFFATGMDALVVGPFVMQKDS